MNATDSNQRAAASAARAVLHLDLEPPLDRIELEWGETVIGRGDDCTLMLPIAKISKRHARITGSEDGWVIEDLGSRNGVYVDGARIAEATSLTRTTTLHIGRVPARFELEIETVEEATASPDEDSPSNSAAADLRAAFESEATWSAWTRTLWVAVWIGIAVIAYHIGLQLLADRASQA